MVLKPPFLSYLPFQQETGNVVLLSLNVDFPSSLPILRFFVKMIGIEKYFNIFYTTQHCFASDILYSSTYYSYSYTPILIFKKVRLGLQISTIRKRIENSWDFFLSTRVEKRELKLFDKTSNNVETNIRFDILYFEISMAFEKDEGNISRPEGYTKNVEFSYIHVNVYTRTDQVSMEIIDTPRNRKVI